MNELIEKHYRENYGRLLKRLTFTAGGHHQAEDVIQESYYRAMKYFNTCREGDFDRWFSMIVRNTVKDYLREEGGFVHIELEEEDFGQHPCSMLDEQTIREVRELISTKSEVQIEILTYHFDYGYAPIDISHLTDYTYAQIHKCIQRFKQEIKDLYG